MASVEQAVARLDELWRPGIGVPNSPAHPDTWGNERPLYVDAQLAIDGSFRQGLGTEISPAHPDGFGHETAGLVQAHLAAGNSDRAMIEFDRYLASIYPSGFSGHYVLGPHRRAGVETKFIDGFVQRAIRLSNGERVSPLAAPPNWAIAALAIADHLEQSGGDAKAWVVEHFDTLVGSTQRLYEERGQNDGMIIQLHPDELTLRDGHLKEVSTEAARLAKGKDGIVGQEITATRIYLQSTADEADRKRLSKDPRQGRFGKKMKYAPMVDIGINALNILNNQALEKLAYTYDLGLPPELLLMMGRSSKKVSRICEKDPRYYGLPSSQVLDASLAGNTITLAATRDEEGRPLHFEGLLAFARLLPTSTTINRRTAHYMEGTMTGLIERFPFGIPTLMRRNESGDFSARNKHDKGTISPPHNLELATLLAQSRLPVLQESGRLIGKAMLDTLAALPENHFPRTLDPDTGESNQAGPATRRIRSRRSDWMPTAAAMVVTARALDY